MQAELPKSFESATSNRRKVHRRRSVTPNPVRPQREIPVEMDVRILRSFYARKPGHQEDRREIFNRSNADFLLIEVCALSFSSRKQFPAHRLINDPGD